MSRRSTTVARWCLAVIALLETLWLSALAVLVYALSTTFSAFEGLDTPWPNVVLGAVVAFVAIAVGLGSTFVLFKGRSVGRVTVPSAAIVVAVGNTLVGVYHAAHAMFGDPAEFGLSRIGLHAIAAGAAVVTVLALVVAGAQRRSDTDARPH